MATHMEAISKIFANLNTLLDKYLFWTVVVALLIANVFMAIKWIQKNTTQQIKQRGENSTSIWARSLGHSLYFFLLSLSIQATLLAVFYFSHSVILRWVEFFVVTCGITYLATNRISGRRGLYISAGHLGILLIGWVYGSWLGLFLISAPLFAVLYYWAYCLAQVVIPASNPDDSKESLQRFKMLVWYLWGVQFPIWVINKETDRTAEERINGDFFKMFGSPGMIWAQSHQAVGITSGTRFSRVDGPGVIYTQPFERPHEIIDLRPQIRTSLIESISQDGIPYQARLLAVFSIDNAVWTNEEYSALRLKNSLLRGAQKPDRKSGNYQYSRSRVTAALSIESVKYSIHETKSHPIIYWDQWALAVAEEAARKELSIYPLNELWRPIKDKQDLNPLDIIAQNIKNNTSQQLKIHGISLIAARIINFQFDSDESKVILQQQIDNWRSYIEQDISQTKSHADAQLVNIKESAAAYARSNLLASIADGLEKISSAHPNLPKKYVVAMQLITALENSLHQQLQTEDKSEENSKLEALRSLLGNTPPPPQR